jgi:peroxiredoxin Q/BCP
VRAGVHGSRGWPIFRAMKLLDTALLAALILPLGAFGCETQSPAPPAAAPSSAAQPATSTTAASVASAPASAAPATAAPSASSSPEPVADAPDDLVGKVAPDFTAVTQKGKPFHLAAAKGKLVVIYFYPKDETAGCTKEACSFRDSWEAIAKTGAVLVGVSADTTDSHKAFAEHYKLPFALISDSDGTIGRLYGVPFDGRLKRRTFVIGTDGTVQKVYRHVDFNAHAAQILDDLTHAAHS